MNKYHSDLDEDPLSSSSPDAHPEELDTPTRPRRAPLNSNCSLSVPLSKIPESPDSSSFASENSSPSKMVPLLSSGIIEWKSHMENHPFLPMFPFSTIAFRDPDAVPAFHRFEFTTSAKLSFDVRFLCSNNNISGVNFGLAAVQIVLSQLTGTDDFVIGLVRVLKGKGNIMPVRFKGDFQHTSNQLLEQTKSIMGLSRRYLHEPVKSWLSELNTSQQALLHQVTFGWIPNPYTYATTQTTDMYFEHA
ncbi:hypothetical protein G6011_08542 [Alternaria panax]|uniref:Uncharacterized protein n=1 Tax=Alternaria panax TaxID=48097 RepID=A0AAD4I9Z6_9PLEO|nr:hypothetical protein G6011_08542 [Alternaria panax]